MNDQASRLKVLPIREAHFFDPHPLQFHSMLKSSLASILFVAVEDVKHARYKHHKIFIPNLSNPLRAKFTFWVGDGFPNRKSKVLNIGMNSRVGPAIARLDMIHLLPYINDEEHQVVIGDSDASFIISKDLLSALLAYNRDREMSLPVQRSINTFLSIYA